MATIKAILVWLAAQVLVIGVVYGLIQAEVHNKTFDCLKRSEKVSVLNTVVISAVLPLAAFVPEDTQIERFCARKKFQ